jgi:hypothetical protein
MPLLDLRAERKPDAGAEAKGDAKVVSMICDIMRKWIYPQSDFHTVNQNPCLGVE